MAKYLFIESRDLFEWADVGYLYDLAQGLGKDGHQVTLYLVQNGVFSARRSPRSGRVGDLVHTGVRVVADDFSLRERGIGQESLVAGIQPASINLVVELLADPETRACWH